MSTDVIPSSEPNRCRVCGVPIWNSDSDACSLCCNKKGLLVREQPAESLAPNPVGPPTLPLSLPPRSTLPSTVSRVPSPLSTLPPLPLLPPPLPPPESRPFTFTLGTLMLAMTLVTVLCGLSVSAPVLGIPLSLISFPCWLYTSQRLAANPKTRENPTLGDKLKTFFGALGLVLLVLVAMFGGLVAALYVICSQTSFH